MFEVGFTEIILIFGIALLVLGPARLPKLAADIGRWAGRARSMARQLRNQLEQETQFDPLADTSPAAARQSNTIHTPASTPAPNAAPTTSPDTSPDTSPVSSPDTADADSRAAPAQLAAATPPARSAPSETLADEPKPG
jgi:sec-independent protein translocase protein TatB